MYAHTGGEFEYGQWLDALKQGRTFITNGPALSLTVQGRDPGDEIEASPGEKLSTLVTWKSHYPVARADVVFNGRVVAGESFPQGSREGRLELDVAVPSDGWIAARLSGSVRDSFDQPVFAHTSPVYVVAGSPAPERAEAARGFNDGIDRDLERVRTRGRFYNDGQRREIEELFREGQQIYRTMLQ